MKKSIALLILPALLGGTAADATELQVELSGYRGNGGRVAWSPTGEFIIFDRKEADGGFDLYLTGDFETERCLTCNHPDLPNRKRNYGQPVIHPEGRYVVFQAEKQKHGFVFPLATNPGAGVFNDIWIYDLKTNRAKALWEVPNDKEKGVLHPQFSKDGSKLSWSEMYDGGDLKVPGMGAGSWNLKVADFSPDGLTNVQQFRPGEDVIYENHGLSHDGEWLYFSSNMKRSEPVNESTNIYRLHLESRELEQLTHEGYNEHAHITPDGKYIVWMSSVGNGDSYDYYKVGTDYWIMNMDGSGKQRLTHLNDPDHSHFRGRYAVAADFDFDPASSQEDGYRMFAYLHELVFKNFGTKAADKKARGEYNFFVDFKIDSVSDDGDLDPNEPSDVTPGDDDGHVDKRVVEGKYGFHFDVGGPDLGMPDVFAHREGDVLFCQAGEAPRVQPATSPGASVDRYPQAPDAVRLVAITEDAARKTYYQLALSIESKNGNASGPFRFMSPQTFGVPSARELEFEEWGTFELQKLDQRESIVDSVSSSPVLLGNVKDLRGRYPECRGTVAIEYSTQCEIDPEANTSCLARCIGTFRCEHLIQTGPFRMTQPQGNPETTKMLPTSVYGSFDLPLLFVTEDGRSYWRGNRVDEDNPPEDYPNWRDWRGRGLF